VSIINENNFLVSGVEIIGDKGYHVMGLCEMDMSLNLLNLIFLGMENVDNFPGYYCNLDRFYSQNVFYGGVSNIDLINPFFSTIPTWILLNNLDNNLNLKWQKFYGGDACYNLWYILATQDGGCVMAGTRYDYQAQNQERDVYILKVNEDGILTWTYNFPEITKQVLVYPNPGHDEIMTKSLASNLVFALFDIQGVKVLSKVIGIEDCINTRDLPQGIYLFQILDQDAKIIETGKWIKN
jgi:hypothetical protein